MAAHGSGNKGENSNDQLLLIVIFALLYIVIMLVWYFAHGQIANWYTYLFKNIATLNQVYSAPAGLISILLPGLIFRICLCRGIWGLAYCLSIF